MTDNDRLLSQKARQLRPSSLDAATLERVPSLFDEKAIGDRRADQAGTRRPLTSERGTEPDVDDRQQ